MKSDSWKPGLLEKWRERPLPKVAGVHGRAPLRGKDEALISIEVAEALHLLYLTGEVFIKGFHRCLREPYSPAASLRFGAVLGSDGEGHIATASRADYAAAAAAVLTGEGHESAV